uniref:Uncharacterized protein n=1 Tax=Arundo donax TaxID=35708 RepID=A0A0A8ZVZ8_ARUDO
MLHPLLQYYLAIHTHLVQCHSEFARNSQGGSDVSVLIFIVSLSMICLFCNCSTY